MASAQPARESGLTVERGQGKGGGGEEAWSLRGFVGIGS